MLILFLIVFIDVMAFGMVLPLLPYLKYVYNVGDHEVGMLVSLFASSALVGSIFWGVMSDRVGRKLMLILPLMISSVVYFFSAYALIFWQALVLRMVSGFLTANFPVAFAAAADSTNGTNRFKAMATLGMAFSFGFILGPTLGGVLSTSGSWMAGFDLLQINIHQYKIAGQESINIELPFLASGLLALISGGLGLLFFKETLTKKDIKEGNKVNLFEQIRNTYKDKTILFFTFLTIIISLIFAGIEVAVSLFLKDQFSLPPNKIGMYWAVFAFSIALARYASMPLFKFPKLAIMLGFTVVGTGILLFVVTSSFVLLAVNTLLMGWGLGLMLTSVNAKLSLQGSKNQQGTIFGINQLFGNFGRAIGPGIIPFLYVYNVNSAWIFLSTLGFMCALLTFKIVKA